MKRETFTYDVAQQRVTVYNMGCLVGMQEKLTKGSVDVLVTSPPY